MDPCLLTMMIGEEAGSKRGIIPQMILLFCMDEKPYWIKKECSKNNGSTIAEQETSTNKAEEITHFPDSNELTYIVTDALLRFQPEVSSNHSKISELFERIRESTGLTTAEFFRDYRTLKHHKESRRILSLIRELFENGMINAKLVINVLVGGPSEQVLDNLMRMNASFELATTSKYRLKDKNGMEESL